MTASTFVKTSLVALIGATTVTIGAVSSAQAFTVVDTAPSWDGNSAIAPWGITNTSTYGQTFTVTGSDNVLQNFSFQIGQTSSPIPFAAYVAEWVGGQNGSIVGSLLYNSGLQSFSNAGSGFKQVNFNTGGIQLNTGSKYVAFLSTSGFQVGQPESTTNFGFVGDDYANGEFVFYNTGDDFKPLLSSNWETFIGGDLAFQAKLTGATAVPTPALLPGLVGLGLGVWRKRKAEAAKQTNEV